MFSILLLGLAAVAVSEPVIVVDYRATISIDIARYDDQLHSIWTLQCQHNRNKRINRTVCSSFCVDHRRSPNGEFHLLTCYPGRGRNCNFQRHQQF